MTKLKSPMHVVLFTFTLPVPRHYKDIPWELDCSLPVKIQGLKIKIKKPQTKNKNTQTKGTQLCLPVEKGTLNDSNKYNFLSDVCSSA